VYAGIIVVPIGSVVSVDIIDPSVTGAVDDANMACVIALEDNDIAFDWRIRAVFDFRLGVFCAAGVFDGAPQSGDGGVPGDGIRLSCIAGAPVNVVRAPLPSVEVRAVINAEQFRGSYRAWNLADLPAACSF